MNYLRPLFPARRPAIFNFLLPQLNHARLLHHSREARPIPPPSSTAPDVNTFLTKIGRNMIQHESKFTDWSHFMASSPEKLREMGIEPARDRRYLISWRERYRNGIAPAEYKRGRKIDGGERRQKMVRALKRIAAKKEQRKKEEQALLMGNR